MWNALSEYTFEKQSCITASNCTDGDHDWDAVLGLIGLNCRVVKCPACSFEMQAFDSLLWNASAANMFDMQVCNVCFGMLV